MGRLLIVGMAMVLSGCNAPFWEKHKREDAEIARQEAVRVKDHETWDAEERRRLLALCLDIAKFEKQWNNFASWEFDPSTGLCTVAYKKPAAEVKTAKQCADEMITDPSQRAGNAPSATASSLTRMLYFECQAETFTKVWGVATNALR